MPIPHREREVQQAERIKMGQLRTPAASALGSEQATARAEIGQQVRDLLALRRSQPIALPGTPAARFGNTKEG